MISSCAGSDFFWGIWKLSCDAGVASVDRSFRFSALPLHAWEPGIPGGVNIALPTNITAEDVAKVINEAGLVGMACSVDELATLAPVLGACRTLRTFVVMDHEGNPNPQLPALVKQASLGA